MTFLDICKAVRSQAGLSGDGPTNVTSQVGIMADVVRWVEESYNEIQTLHENWNFLFTEGSFTLQNTWDEYPLLSQEGLRVVSKDNLRIQFQDEDKTRLKYISYVKFKDSYLYLKSDTGRPEYVMELPNGSLRFYPTPDEDFTVYYEGFTVPDIMENSTDVPVFSAQYHELIKLLALMRYAEFYSADTVYNSAEASYNRILPKMKYSELPRESVVTRPLV